MHSISDNVLNSKIVCVCVCVNLYFLTSFHVQKMCSCKVGGMLGPLTGRNRNKTRGADGRLGFLRGSYCLILHLGFLPSLGGTLGEMSSGPPLESYSRLASITPA